MSGNNIIRASDITGRYWRFSTATGYVGTESFEFLHDGRIFGPRGQNEVFWEVKGDSIHILDKERTTSLILRKTQNRDGRNVFEGEHIPDPSIILILEEKGPVHPTYGSLKYSLEDEIRYLGWEVGSHSYGMPSFVEKGMSRLVVGKYCSIAEGCKISFGDHRTDFATTYPFASLRHFWKGPEGINDHQTKGDVVIGSDVWIGADVFIGSGVRIGHGAVIGGRAVVTRDVPPYAIAVGSPARTVRYRFPDTVISALLETAWWELEDEQVEELLPLMMSTRIEDFIEAVRDIRNRALTR